MMSFTHSQIVTQSLPTSPLSPLDQPLLHALTRHFGAAEMVLKTILRYQWNSTEHGWSALLGQQYHEFSNWLDKVRLQFEERGVNLPSTAVETMPVRFEDTTPEPIDGLALAARMMTDFESLAWDIEATLVLVEQTQSPLNTDMLLGLDVFYRRAAATYRQYLCTSLHWLE